MDRLRSIHAHGAAEQRVNPRIYLKMLDKICWGRDDRVKLQTTPAT